MVAVEGDNVTLPCGIPSIKTCSSISWDMSAEFNLTDEIIKKEKPTAPNSHRYRLLKDCSLQITQLVLNDARLYTCKRGTLKSSVSLRILCSKCFCFTPSFCFFCFTYRNSKQKYHNAFFIHQLLKGHFLQMTKRWSFIVTSVQIKELTPVSTTESFISTGALRMIHQ